jgi:hypothetical protein
VKRNAIAGHRFGSWAAMEAHLARWTREVADVRINGTTGGALLERFARDEAAALRPPRSLAASSHLQEARADPYLLVDAKSARVSVVVTDQAPVRPDNRAAGETDPTRLPAKSVCKTLCDRGCFAA